MKQMPLWFNRYRSGVLRGLDAFKAEIARARVARDAPSTAFERFTGTLDDGLKFEAPQRLKAPSLMTAESTLRRHELADWQSVDIRVQIFAAKLIEAFRKRDVPLYVHSAFRTEAEQDALLLKGVSRARFPYAPHCQGYAVDIVHARYHWQLTKDEWALIGKVGKDVSASLRFPMKWGGDFPTFYDPAHWEFAHWRDHIEHPSQGAPVRKTPRGILAEFKGLS